MREPSNFPPHLTPLIICHSWTMNPSSDTETCMISTVNCCACYLCSSLDALNMIKNHHHEPTVRSDSTRRAGSTATATGTSGFNFHSISKQTSQNCVISLKKATRRTLASVQLRISRRSGTSCSAWPYVCRVPDWKGRFKDAVTHFEVASTVVALQTKSFA